MNAPKKRGRPANEVGGGSLPLATASSPVAAVSSATPTNGGHPRNAPAMQTMSSRTTLKNAGVILIDCDHNTPKYQSTGKPYVCIPQLKGGRLDLGNVQRISDTDFIQWTKKAKPVYNDVILSRRCNPGEIAHVPEGLELALGQNLVLLRASNPDVLYPPFLRWATQGPNWWEQVNQFMNVGAVFTSLKCADIPKFEIDLPSLDDQKRISNILGTLDDKIALNRRINQTLEAMAQALFQSWFVDFDPVKAKQQALDVGGTVQDAELAAMQVISGKSPAQLKAFQKQQPEQYVELERTAKLFPSKLVESELGLIPEGWEVSSIGKEVQVLGGGTPSTANPEFWENGIIHWTTPKDLSNQADKILLNTDRKITEKGLTAISSQLMSVDTILMSSRAPVGYLAMAKIPVAVNQGYIAMRCEKTLSPEFIIQWCSSVMEEIKQRASGTTFAEISKKVFGSIPVILPNDQIVKSYSGTVKRLYDLITNNAIQVQQLTEARDSLLPKLLSGELDVTAIEV